MQIHSCWAVVPNATEADCAPQSEIDEIVNEVAIDIFQINFYFDDKEFDDSPVKAYVQY